MRNRVLKYLLMIAGGTAMLFMAYGIGAGFIPFASDIDTGNTGTSDTAGVAEIPTVETRLVGTHTVEYVEETVTEIEYVDVIRTLPVQLRNFASLTEMEQWLDNADSIITVRFDRDDTVTDCDDYALELQQRALAEGYVMSFEIISGTEYNELFSLPLPSGQSLHAINLALIGNDVYYIEPQTGEVVHAAYLD